MKFIDISPEIQNFKEHLITNPRTVLSAKFGDGKTTFLEYFAREVKNEYQIIILRPINYSVLSNEDIFEYIKRDILVQLFEKDLIPKISEDGIWDLVKNNVFTLENINQILDGVIQFLPHSEAIRSIKKTIISLIQKNGGIKNLMQSISPEQEAEDYIASFAISKGGLYEEDAYTLLIRHCLSALGKKTILIIEDLDRLDPGHLFRILNILGAHVDNGSDENKFGFDNIVVVLDYNVTHKLFEHFYGRDCSYDGYMSKFMSHYPFNFSITDAAYDRLYELIESKCGIPRGAMSTMCLSKSITRFDSELRKKSVRDIAHAIDEFELQYICDIIKCDSGYRISTDEKIVRFLSILKRLNIDLDRENIYKSINSLQYGGLELLGGFVLCGYHVSEGFFHYQGGVVTLTIVSDQCGISTCVFRDGGFGYESRFNVEKACRIAFDTASKYVCDFDQVR